MTTQCSKVRRGESQRQSQYRRCRLRRDTLRGVTVAMLTLLCGAASMMFLTKDLYADVRIEKSDPNSSTFFIIFITNSISQKDAQYITQYLNDFRYSGLNVFLDSAGGDVDAAMKIGRVIRKHEGFTTVLPNAKCYSSCALLYIAGVWRTNLGIIGLHRPYFSSAPQSREVLERQVPLMLQQLRSYVQEMGVTDIFYQEMVNTEPSEIRVYLAADIKKAVPENDPTYDEIQTSYEARKYGVDTKEMRSRKADSEKCYVQKNVGECIEASSWGLSERVYKERASKTSACFTTTDEDTKTFASMGRGWRDHPKVLKQEACVRNVMLGR